MGNDGGSIAKRDELVRIKPSSEKVDPELLRQSLYTVCTLSRQPLTPPVASDPLGKLYNKDAVVQHLLSRHATSSSSPSAPDPTPHIRGLRDIVELKLTPNNLYRPPSPSSPASEGSVYPFMCPLSRKQMDGKQKFIYIASCGCAMSATGLKATVAASKGSDGKEEEYRPCPVCGKQFNAGGLAKGKQAEVGGDVVTINPSAEEEAEMRNVMEKRRAEEKAKKKKAKARTADEAEAPNGDAEEDKAEKRRRKAQKKAEKSAKIAALQAELAAEQ
ncbi:related to Protein C20orf43 [Ustilago sp. UG-2017b]|nr:related to Protein C20orf43 [Ustilago sp. UG-2017b]